MSIVGSFFATSVSDLVKPSRWFLDWGTGGRTAAGQSVSPQSSYGLSAYYASIRAISEDCGKLPLITYRRLQPRGKERATDHFAFRMLHDLPNPTMTSMPFRETLTAWALGWGNGYAEIQRLGNGRPVAMWPIHPSRVLLNRDNPNRPHYEVRVDTQSQGSQRVRIPLDDMFHIRGLADDGLEGMSVARVGAESLGLSLAAQNFGASFFGNATRPSGVLLHPELLGDEELKRLRESWKTAYQGSDTAGTPLILEEGMKWEQIAIPPEDAQFLQTREFQVVEIARWFRIPPHKLQALGRATWGNIGAQAVEYVGDTLLPWLTRWEQEIRWKVFGLDDTFFAEHQVKGLLRGDPKAQAEYYKTRFLSGSMSQNDIRECENENPIESGDTYYVPANLVRTEDAAQGRMTNQSRRSEGTVDQQGGRPDQTAATMESALRPVLLDAADRVLRRERKATERAAKRHQGDPEGFQRWAERFYGEQEEIIVSTFGPAASALAESQGRAPPDLSQFARELSQADLERALGAELIDDPLERSQAIVTKLQEVCGGCGE